MNNKTLSRNPRDGDVIPAADEFPLLASQQAMNKIMKLIVENLGGQGMNAFQLPRIRVIRESAKFEIETASGTATESALTGVITAFRQTRAYYKRAYAGGKDRPDCSSTDGFLGVGDPGGPCAECPYAQFKSARNADGSQGAGQACQEKRQLLLLLADNMLPHRLDVPTTSVALFQKYSLNLVYAGASYWSVVTKLTAEHGKTASGMKVAYVNFTLYKRLNEEQTNLLEPYHDKMVSVLKPMLLEAEADEQPADAPAGPPATDQTTSPDDIPF